MMATAHHAVTAATTAGTLETTAAMSAETTAETAETKVIVVTTTGVLATMEEAVDTTMVVMAAIVATTQVVKPDHGSSISLLGGHRGVAIDVRRGLALMGMVSLVPGQLNRPTLWIAAASFTLLMPSPINSPTMAMTGIWTPEPHHI